MSYMELKKSKLEQTNIYESVSHLQGFRKTVSAFTSSNLNFLFIFDGIFKIVRLFCMFA